MQTVSNTFLAALQANSKDLVKVVEIYHQDAVPGAGGFDPQSGDFLVGYAKVAGVSFRTRNYKRLLLSTGGVSKHLDKELSGFDFTLSNLSREVVDFELATGYEGLICVVRVLDRNLSTNLNDSIVEFVGRCEKPETFDRRSESVSIAALQILNSTEVIIPRRTFSPDDPEGRVPSDPLFEGFRIQHRTGSVNYTEKKRFLIFFSKRVTRTLQYSSHSDFQSSQAVPVALGRVQTEMIQLAYADQGNGIAGTGAWCEGEIEAYESIRSVTPGFPLDATADKFGELGGVGNQINDDPGWVGSGIYSRLAYSRYYARGSRPEDDDPAPQIVSIIFGTKVPLPDGTNDFTNITEFSDNPVYQSRWLMNSPDYFNLAHAFFDDDLIVEAGEYCEQVLVDHTLSERVIYPNSQSGIAGTAYKNFKSTAIVGADYYKARNDASLNKSAAFIEANYEFYATRPDIIDDQDGDDLPDYPTYDDPAATEYRRRYTSNVILKEQMPAIDFLFDILFPSANLFLTQTAAGQLAVKVNKPADFSFLYADSVVGATEVHVRSIEAWKTNQGRLLVGVNQADSEIRTITGWRYNSTVSIAVSASGGVSWSSGTLTGGSDTVAPNSTLTVSTSTGTKSITIDGYTTSYIAAGGDTTATVAGRLASQINSHPILTRYIKAAWTPNTSTVLVSSKIGYLTLASALDFAHNKEITSPAAAPTLTQSAGAGSLAAGDYEVSYAYQTAEGETLPSPVQTITLAANKNIDVSAVTPLPDPRITAVNWYVSQETNGIRRKRHSQNAGGAFTISALPTRRDEIEPVENQTAEEVLRIAMAFTDAASDQADLSRSNMLKGSFRFPLGKRQPSINQVVGKFRDASQDFRLTELRVNDYAHQAKVKKVNKEEISLAAVDSYNQARRLLNQKLAEWRDGDFFHGLTSDGEALLLEEGDIIAVTDESGRFVNEPVRVEDIESSDDNGYPTISIVARKYRRYFFDDQVVEKILPTPTVLNNEHNTETESPTLWQFAAATNTYVDLAAENFNAANAKYRKVEVSAASDMSSPTVTVVNEVPMEPVFRVTKVSEAPAVTKYIRVSFSSNNVLYGNVSNILAVTFADNTGSGGSGGGSDPCFAGWMLFRTFEGDLVPMETLFENRKEFIGKPVARSYDHYGAMVPGVIEDVFVHEVKEYLQISFASGEIHHVTEEHPYFLGDRYRAIGSLRIGDSVMDMEGEFDRIELITPITPDKPVKVYNARIRQYQNYTVGRKHVHNLKEAPVL